MSDLAASVTGKARSLGFDWCGFAPAEVLHEEAVHLRQWLEEGRHGEMNWLARDPDRRTDPNLVLPECRTVIVLGMNYLREPAPKDQPAKTRRGQGRISKYARTRDYHRVIENRLRKLAAFIDRQLAPGARTRPYVDYGPVLERPWAARAGIGFVGKHTLLISPTQGSFHFLSILLTTAEIHTEPPAPVTSGCGDCRRCIDACPTGAITEPYRLDARRCLSYLTIEKKQAIEEQYWPHFEGNVFGCDICQDVCPYNQSRAPFVTDSPLGPLLVPAEVRLADLIRNPRGFLDSLGESASPLRRAGPESLSRNAMIVASTDGTSEDAQAMEEAANNPQFPDWLRQTARSALQRLKSMPESPEK